MKSFIYIPEISIYIFINIKISIKRCKNVEFFTKNALQTAKCKILFKIVEKVSKYEKNNTIHNGCWRSGPEQACRLCGRRQQLELIIINYGIYYLFHPYPSTHIRPHTSSHISPLSIIITYTSFGTSSVCRFCKYNTYVQY